MCIRDSRYLERNGLSATIHKIENKLGGKSETSYDAWCQKYDVKKEELEEQRKRTFSYQPLFSVVVPLYRTKPEFLKEMIGSIQAQTYGNWQLCLADGSLSGDVYKRQALASGPLKWIQRSSHGSSSVLMWVYSPEQSRCV